MRSMNPRRTTLLTLLAIGMLSAPDLACLWDYDTLAVEARRFPSTIELIAGKFARHSKAFYEWRVEDRLARLQAKPGDHSLTDDLAVAYDKLGKRDEGIQVLRDQLAKSPNRYETHANLGTLLIHNGQFEEGLKHIEQAIEINPNAHFGREKYQALVVRYLLANEFDPAMRQPLPIAPKGDISDADFAYNPRGFRKFLIDNRTVKVDAKGEELPDRLTTEERDSAIKGIQGMMRFGNFQSPVLLEVLGDLLADHGNGDAKRLGSRAYLAAARNTQGETSQAYREMAKSALFMQVIASGSQTAVTVSSIESNLNLEIKNADTWVAKMHADEAKWIAEGVNVDEAFKQKYLTEPVVYSFSNKRSFLHLSLQSRIGIIVGVLIALGLLVLATYLGLRFAARRVELDTAKGK